jgi:uncharacterized protein (TIGR01777 family)
MRVFVTGGTGLIGTQLVKQLLARGDQAVVLTRRYAHARQLFGPHCSLVEGDPMKAGAWMDAIVDCDGVVHLAGENIFGRRWNPAFKTLLFESRVQSTRNVTQALARKPLRFGSQPKVLVNASAIGYYGPQGDQELTEESPPGADFLADLCVQWEKAAHAVETAGVRCVCVRVGIVLDKEGGALAQLLLPFKMFVGGPVGKGRQWMSWIHKEDIVGLFLFALDQAEAHGTFNGTAPNPVTNRDFAKALGRALHRPAFMPTPSFGLRVLLGEAACLVSTGQRVLPEKPLLLGYTFKHPRLDEALTHILH